MTQFDFNSDSAPDVALKANRLVRAVVGQIRRLGGGQPKAVVDIAIGAWETAAKRNRIGELASMPLPLPGPADMIDMQRRDASAYFDECLDLASGDARLIHAARALLDSAVDDVLRHG